MPYGADAVVPVEDTDGGMPEVAVNAPTAVGRYIRHAGDDVPAGAIVLKAGTMIDARQTALLAAVGRGRVRVHPRPRVVVVSTGNELVEPGHPVGPGLINDVNGIMLSVAALDIGAEAHRVGPVPDDAAQLTATLEDQLVRADLIITTGGVSAGAYDTVKAVLSQLGTVEFTSIAMQPGNRRATAPRRDPDLHVAGQSGERLRLVRGVRAPGAAQVPRLQRAVPADGRSPRHERFRLTSGETPVRSRTTRLSERRLDVPPEHVPGLPSGGWLAHANAIAVVPEEVEHVPANSTVTVMRLDTDHGA